MHTSVARVRGFVLVLLSRACVGKIGSICARLHKDATECVRTDHPEVDFEAKTLRLIELEQRLVRSDLSQQRKPHTLSSHFRLERVSMQAKTIDTQSFCMHLP